MILSSKPGRGAFSVSRLPDGSIQSEILDEGPRVWPDARACYDWHREQVNAYGLMGTSHRGYACLNVCFALEELLLEPV
jgi:hypothetical protein